MRIITVSPVVTSRELKGHPYWFHKTLADAASELSIDYKTVGSKSDAGPWVLGMLSHPGVSRPASAFFIWWQLAADVKALSSLVSESQEATLVHIYELGFREFFLCSWILKKNPNSRALINMNLTDPWHSLIQGSSSLNRLARGYIRWSILSSQKRVAVTAETFEMAQSFSKHLELPVFEYPLFSTMKLEDGADRHVKERKYDVTFFPANSSENKLVLEALCVLRESHPTQRALCVPRWDFILSEDELQKMAALGVDVIQNTLGAEDYARLYLESKVAFFPYVAEYYKHTSSGRLLDASAAGFYCIAPESSLAGGQIQRASWGGVFDESCVARDVAIEMAKGLEAWPSFKSTAGPTAENALRRMVEISLERMVAPAQRWNSAFRYVGPFAPLIFWLSTGYRSWLPRLYQAIRNWVES